MTDIRPTDHRSQDDRSHRPSPRNHPNPRHADNSPNRENRRPAPAPVDRDARVDHGTEERGPAAPTAFKHAPGVVIPREPTIMSDVKSLRDRARRNIEHGAVTERYQADREVVLRLLDDALATELVCVLRYKRHYFMASGVQGMSVAAEFQEHAAEEQAHADLLAARIVQLGGAPNFDPAQLTARSHAQYVEGHDLAEMIREDLVAERIAIDSYGEMIRYLGDDDPTTRRMLESILAAEEEHAEDLISLLQGRGA